MRLEKALKEYSLARVHAPLDDHLSSASKNIGSTHWRLAVLLAPGNLLFILFVRYVIRLTPIMHVDTGVSRGYIHTYFVVRVSVETLCDNAAGVLPALGFTPGVFDKHRRHSKLSLTDEVKENTIKASQLLYYTPKRVQLPLEAKHPDRMLV